MIKFGLRFKTSAAEEEFIKFRRPLFKRFFIFIILVVCLISIYVWIGAEGFGGNREIIMICIPLLLCVVCMLFEPNFRFTELFALLTCAALYGVIYYYRFKNKESTEDITFGFFIGFFERIVIERLPLFRHKVMFGICALGIRLGVMGFGIYQSVIFQVILSVLAMLLDLNKESKEKAIFKSFYDSKETILKFKELFKSHMLENVIVLTTNLQEVLFVNESFKTNFKDSVGSVKIFLKQLKLDKEDLKKVTSKMIQSGIIIEAEERAAEPYSFETNDMTKSHGWENRTNISLFNLLLAAQKIEVPPEEALLDYLFTYSPFEEDTTYMIRIKAFKFIWDGQTSLALCLNDITEHYTLMNLKLADETKDRVVATVSHELRTPLNGILGIVQIMEKEVLQPHLMKHIQTCKSSAKLLLSLVNSILDQAQLKNEKLKLSVETYNLKSIMDDIISLFDFQCKEKGIYFKLEMEAGLPARITTDRNRLTQILINLIGNALKFTFKGGITVSINGNFQNSNYIIFSVSDTGIGISEKDKAKLFTLYGKLEGSAKMNPHGAGLGLNISDALAKLLNDNEEGSGIKVDSQFGKGSTFSFRIKKELNLESQEENRNNRQLTCKEITLGNIQLEGIPRLERSQEENRVSSKNNIEGMLSFDKDESQLKVEEGSIVDTPKINRYHLARNLTLDVRPRLHELKPDQSPPKTPIIGSYNLDYSCASPTTNLLGSNYIFLNRSGLNILSNSPNVLIVDDSPFNLMIARELIEAQGYNVDTALNGKLAIESVITRQKTGQPYRLILMDCEMPVMNGFDATKALVKKIKKGEIDHVNIVALSANNVSTIKLKCIKAGMIECLQKPIIESDLKKALAKYA